MNIPLYRRLVFRLVFIVAALGVTMSETRAAITWGSTAIGDGVDYYQSDGSTGFPTDGSFTFELGYFDSSFVPTDSNLSDWATNWIVFDAAIYQEGIGGVPSSVWFQSTASVNTDGTSSSSDADPSTAVFPGEQAYVWIYDTQTPGPGMEWLLYTNDDSDGDATDDWIFPSYQGQNPSTLFWTVENASAVVFGGLNDTQGPGVYEDPPSFELQSHTIPEPISTVFIGALAAGGYLARRRRQRK